MSGGPLRTELELPDRRVAPHRVETAFFWGTPPPDPIAWGIVYKAEMGKKRLIELGSGAPWDDVAVCGRRAAEQLVERAGECTGCGLGSRIFFLWGQWGEFSGVSLGKMG